MKPRRALALMLSAALLLPAAGAAQSDDLKALRQEIDSLKASIGAVQRDVQEIKTLLQGALGGRQAGPPPPLVPGAIQLSVANSYANGGDGSRMVLGGVSDLQI